MDPVQAHFYDFRVLDLRTCLPMSARASQNIWNADLMPGDVDLMVGYDDLMTEYDDMMLVY